MGRARTVKDKTFCERCRQALLSSPPGAAPAPARRPAARAPVVGVPDRPRTTRRHVRPKRNFRPLYVGGAVGMAGLAALLVLLLRSMEPNAPAPPDHPANVEAAGASGRIEAEEKARQAMVQIERFLFAQPEVDVALVELRKFEAQVRGTSVEEEWKKLVNRWERRKREAAAGQDVEALLKEARELAGADGEAFKRRDDVVALFARARARAAEEAPDRMADVKEAERRYEDAYEQKAAAWWKDRSDLVQVLESEKKFQEALQVIDLFPDELRGSRVWKQVQRQREEIDKKRADLAVGRESKDWKYHLRVGNQDLSFKNYRAAKEHLLKAAAMRPPREDMTIDEKRAVAWMHYNLGCLCSIEAASAEGEARAKSIEAAFEHLDRAVAAEVFNYHCCSSHNRAIEHWEKDKDLDALRADPRFEALLKEGRK